MKGKGKSVIGKKDEKEGKRDGLVPLSCII